LSVSPPLSVGEAWAAQSPAAVPGEASICYADTEHSPTRLVLDVKFHSRLPTSKEGGRQAVWDADGKHAYTEGTQNRMAVFDGAIVTSSGGRSQLPGAHLGGTSYFVRGAPGKGPQGGQADPVFWECTSDEPSPVPNTWLCTIRAESIKTTSATLQKTKVTKECDVFQDTK